MKQHLTLGVSMTLASTLSYAILTAIVKAQSANIPTPVIVFIQSLVTLILIVPVIIHGKKEAFNRIKNSPYILTHFFRTIFSLGISYLLFLAVGYIPLVNGLLLANTAPLMVPFLAYIFMAQPFNHRLWIPLLIGFGGIILVLRPDSSLFQPAALLALGAGFCMACSMLLVRHAAKIDNSITTSFYYFLFSTLISGAVAIGFWVPLSLHDILILITEGTLFFIVQLTVVKALQNIPAELVSSLYYTNIIFGAIIGIIVWKTDLPEIVWVGTILTCLGGLLCIRAQRRS